MAAEDLTTLADVKAWMSITSSDHDAVLTRLITAASVGVSNWLNRNLFATNYDQRFNGTGSRILVLPEYPVLSVSAVYINGAAVPVGSDSNNGYFFDRDGVELSGYTFDKGVRNVRVVFRAGYEQVPQEVAQAVIELVSLRHKERDRIGLVSKGLAGETITFTQKDFTASVRSMLMPYKKVSFS